MKIAVFVGSLRGQSSNRALAHAMEQVAPVGTEFHYVDINLPLYSEDIENAGIPEEVTRVKDAVEDADGVLFVTPEYNRSVPGVLKNAIDWVSRPYGQTSFAGKPIGIVGSSVGPVGTAVSQADLKRIMLFQGSKVMGQPEVYVANAYEVFDEKGTLASERWEKNLRQYMEAFVDWVQGR